MDLDSITNGEVLMKKIAVINQFVGIKTRLYSLTRLDVQVDTVSYEQSVLSHHDIQ